MALGRTFAGLMQASQPYWDSILVSANRYQYQLSDKQTQALRIVGYVDGRDQFDVSGSYGTAFERDDGRVVKVTIDPADLAAHVLLRNSPHVLDIYDIFKLDPVTPVPPNDPRRFQAPTTLYAMVVEHVDDLPSKIKREPGNWQFDKMDIRRIIEFAGGEFSVEARPERRPNFGKPSFEYPNRVRALLMDFCKRDWSGAVGTPLRTRELKQAFELDRKSTEFCNGFMEQLFLLSTAAAKQGIALDDFHSGNFGISRKTGQWALRDLGGSEKYPDVAVRAVAGLSGLRSVR